MGGWFSFTTRAGSSAASARMRRLPKALRNAQTATMERATRMVEADLKGKSLSGTKGRDDFWGVTGAKGDALGVRSGHLRRSITGQVLVGAFGTFVTGIVGTAQKIARIHEEGGTVRGNPWLRIPTKIMQTAAGVDRLAGRSARTLPNAIVIKSKAGHPWIVEVGTPRSKLAQQVQGFPLMLYMLVKSVTHRARHPFKRTLERMRPKIRALFSGRFSAVLRNN